MLRMLYAYDTLVRQNLGMLQGHRRLAARRTPSHNVAHLYNAQCTSVSTTVQHMPQPCRAMNAPAFQSVWKALFTVC